MVLQSGRAIPAAALSLEGDQFVVKTTIEGFTAGQSIPVSSVDHIYGEKPAQFNQAVALALTGRSKEAKDMLLPVVKEHSITAKIPGNFWLDAARALLVAHALNGDAAATTAIGKEIADATSSQGMEPFVLLGKALLMSDKSTSDEDRQSALRDLTSDSLPDDLRAYASYFRGNILRQSIKNTESLDAYLSVPCLYPSGGLILNAAAELKAADLLAELKRPDEAVVLVQSALRASTGTVLEHLANTRLESLKVK